MTQVSVSSKYQIVIPREVRQQVPVRTGQKLAVIVKEGMIALIPLRPLASLRGFLRGMKTDVIREKRDRV